MRYAWAMGFGHDRLEAACLLTIDLKELSYRFIVSILGHGLESKTNTAADAEGELRQPRGQRQSVKPGATSRSKRPRIFRGGA
ncbi:hypothetical protein [Caballeronia arvi]|uniref:hypothetical protein n=1 Tax=Caballeronia arvi TaxID=1777135 RepID=UPI00117DE40B|nr:hypothetical protein [Caballeronia arvi]